MSKRKNFIQLIALFLMLIVLPAGSWYYLQSGFDYQKQARAELLDYGKIPANTKLLSTEGQELTLSDSKHQLSIFSFVSKDKLNNERVENWKKLYEQFEETGRAKFFLGALDTLVDFSTFEQLPRNENCVYLNAENSKKIIAHLEEPQLKTERINGGKYQTQKINDWTNYNYTAIVDTTFTIRNYYQIDEMESLKRMVEHLAILVPREKSKKPVLIREKEK